MSLLLKYTSFQIVSKKPFTDIYVLGEYKGKDDLVASNGTFLINQMSFKI